MPERTGDYEALIYNLDTALSNSSVTSAFELAANFYYDSEEAGEELMERYSISRSEIRVALQFIVDRYVRMLLTNLKLAATYASTFHTTAKTATAEYNELITAYYEQCSYGDEFYCMLVETIERLWPSIVGRRMIPGRTTVTPAAPAYQPPPEEAMAVGIPMQRPPERVLKPTQEDIETARREAEERRRILEGARITPIAMPPAPAPAVSVAPVIDLTAYTFYFPLSLQGLSQNQKTDFIRTTVPLAVKTGPARSISKAEIDRYISAALRLYSSYRQHRSRIGFLTLTEDGDTTLQIRVPANLPVKTADAMTGAVNAIVNPQPKAKTTAPVAFVNPLQAFIEGKFYGEYFAGDTVYSSIRMLGRNIARSYARMVMPCIESKGITETKLDDLWDQIDWHSSPATAGSSRSSLYQSVQDNIGSGVGELFELVGCREEGRARAEMEGAALEALEAARDQITALEQVVREGKPQDAQQASQDALELRDELNAAVAELFPTTEAEIAEEAREEEQQEESELLQKMRNVFKRTAKLSLSNADFIAIASFQLRYGPPTEVGRMIDGAIEAGYIRRMENGELELA